MSTVEQPRKPRLHVSPPDEALRSACPLPQLEDLVITDVSDDEWAAFLEALAENMTTAPPVGVVVDAMVIRLAV